VPCANSYFDGHDSLCQHCNSDILRQPRIVTGRLQLPVTMRARLHRRSIFVALAQVTGPNILSDEPSATSDAWCIVLRHDAGAAHHKILSKSLELSFSDHVGH